MTKIRAGIKDLKTGLITGTEFSIKKKWEDITPQDVRKFLKPGQALHGYALIK